VFDEQSPAALVAAIRRFEREEARFDAASIRRHAERFAVPRFCDEIRAEIDRCLAGEEDPIPA
jgi:hypothetical protein